MDLENILSDIESNICYQFKDRSLLKKALTLKATRQGPLHNYERLEFLGDAVMALVVADLLYREFSKEKEGTLSKLRAAIVSEKNLVQIGEKFRLKQLIQAYNRNQAVTKRILADIVEAIIGAVYVDGGFEEAKKVCINLIGEDYKRRSALFSDPKTTLQETAHALGMPTPVYTLESKTGPDHAPLFESCVRIGDTIITYGKGKTKQSSEEDAAVKAQRMLDELQSQKG